MFYIITDLLPYMFCTNVGAKEGMKPQFMLRQLLFLKLPIILYDLQVALVNGQLIPLMVRLSVLKYKANFRIFLGGFIGTLSWLFLFTKIFWLFFIRFGFHKYFHPMYIVQCHGTTHP